MAENAAVQMLESFFEQIRVWMDLTLYRRIVTQGLGAASLKKESVISHFGGIMGGLRVYVASSFRHLHAVRLLNRELRSLGCVILDWTEKATPPEGLNAAQRRVWMDTDHGGEVFVFCAKACREADLVLYVGAAGQDAGVEVGMAYGQGVPIFGLRGPLESPGLMLHGAISLWADSMDRVLSIMEKLVHEVKRDPALRKNATLTQWLHAQSV